ncbi:MAG: phytanoyl-CoA dioxygenase family protein [Hymenobacter sp.]|nr:phytanoyl-CoA dioxygenase family protein [Hymenobacter sp.]
MSIVYFDSSLGEQVVRQKLYEGDLFVYSPRPSVLALCDFARTLTEEAFGSIHPTLAQHHFAPDEYAKILARLKPVFINHPHSKQLIQDIFREMGFDLEKTYFDVPRMRTATSNGYLTTGIAYSFEPHRDTWFSAPLNQLNWWIPMYDIEAENCLTFFPGYWNKPVPNESVDYDCRRWYAEGRRIQAEGTKDTRRRPQPLESVSEAEELRLLCNVGGMILFSGAHLHGTVPNTTGRTRFSIDFRTVHLDDVATRAGAPNLDTLCTGTLMGDFLHPLTLVPVPEPLIALYEQGTPVQTAKAERVPR